MSVRGVVWLDGALSGLLPTTEHGCLLRACLAPSKAGQQAWQRYRAGVRDPRDRVGRDPRARVLAPLLYESLRRHELAEGSFHTYLRTAYLREVLRSRARQRIAGTVLAALADTGVDGIALGETALAETVYDEPALRHSGGLELLLRDADVPRAVRMAERLGFAVGQARRGGGEETTLIHPTAVPLVVRSRLFRWPCYGLPEDETWARSQPSVLAGVPTRLLSPADSLTHVCGDVFDRPGHPRLQWVADAWFIIRRSSGVDWSVLLEAASRGRLAVPLAVTLGYLVQTLGAPVPPGVLAALREQAARPDPLARDMALMAARLGTWRGFWGTVSRTSGWASRIAVVGHTLVPSRAYLALTQGRGNSGVIYFRRMARHAGVALRRRPGRGSGLASGGGDAARVSATPRAP